MSQLWIQTVAAEPWYGMDTAKRRPDLVKRIAEGHQVPEHRARNVLNKIGRHLYAEREYMHPVEYGEFTSAPKQMDPDYSLLPDEATEEGPWYHRPVEHADIGFRTPVHAIQGFLYTRGLAHAALWPGRRQDLRAYGDPKVGHPDIEPTAYEEEHYGAPTDASRLVRKHNGLWVVDGHHRIAVDRMLGKSTTPARVADISEFGHHG